MRFPAVILSMLVALATTAQINIWEGTECKKKVTLTPYLVENAQNSKAVIVCPGGSYFWHDSATEGHEVAKWLQSNGIAAFVLDYRAAQIPAFIFHHRYLFRGNRYPDPQDDLRQSIRLISSESDKYGINPDSIGVMGFSAGGHLVMSSAELFDPTDWPAFIVPVYPVVTMTQECVHKRSRRGLLGDNRQRDKALCDSLSLERHVPEGCPPVFIVNCVDDPVVDYRNSVLLDSALTAKGISHKYLRFQTGGHGFGASDTKGTEECRQWRPLFLQWLNELGTNNQSTTTPAQP